jgi:hypothetical protein
MSQVVLRICGMVRLYHLHMAVGREGAFVAHLRVLSTVPAFAVATGEGGGRQHPMGVTPALLPKGVSICTDTIRTSLTSTPS